MNSASDIAVTQEEEDHDEKASDSPFLLAKSLVSAWSELCDLWSVSMECWEHDFQYVVNIEDREEIIARVEFCGDDILFSMYAMVRFGAIHPFLQALDQVVQGSSK